MDVSRNMFKVSNKNHIYHTSVRKIYIYIITQGQLYRVKVEDQLSEVSGNRMKGYTLREKIKYDYYWSFLI